MKKVDMAKKRISEFAKNVNTNFQRGNIISKNCGKITNDVTYT